MEIAARFLIVVVGVFVFVTVGVAVLYILVVAVFGVVVIAVVVLFVVVEIAVGASIFVRHSCGDRKCMFTCNVCTSTCTCTTHQLAHCIRLSCV